MYDKPERRDKSLERQIGKFKIGFCCKSFTGWATLFKSESRITIVEGNLFL